MKNKRCLLFVLLINNRPFEPHASHASIVYSDDCVVGVKGGHCDWQLGTPCQQWDAVTNQVRDEHRAWHQRGLGGVVSLLALGVGLSQGVT